jgi:hypothetical protein
MQISMPKLLDQVTSGFSLLLGGDLGRFFSLIRILFAARSGRRGRRRGAGSSRYRGCVRGQHSDLPIIALTNH